MFDKRVSLQSILYVIKSYGGECDLHRMCKVLYFADQASLSRYGRQITGDDYIAMENGPVPSRIYDLFKAVRGDSYFSPDVRLFSFKNNVTLQSDNQPDMDYLSESDIECLNEAIEKCRDLSFGELTKMSHGYAWSATAKNQTIKNGDILREAGDTEGYIDYINTLKRESTYA